jgi:hypothetical protein
MNPEEFNKLIDHLAPRRTVPDWVWCWFIGLMTTMMVVLLIALLVQELGLVKPHICNECLKRIQRQEVMYVQGN